MLERGEATVDELEHLRNRIQQEVDDAIAWAEASPYPDPSTLTEGVYEEPV
jgi:pyruvate dehydrogenase E1 component alpha subunit